MGFSIRVRVRVRLEFSIRVKFRVIYENKMVIDVNLYLKKRKRRDTPSMILADPIIYIELEQIVTIISAKKNPEAKQVALIGMRWFGLEIIL